MSVLNKTRRGGFTKSAKRKIIAFISMKIYNPECIHECD